MDPPLNSTNARLSRLVPIIRIRWGSRSERFTLADLALPANADDDRIKAALARHLQVPPGQLTWYAVLRLPNGDFLVRPGSELP